MFSRIRTVFSFIFFFFPKLVLLFHKNNVASRPDLVLSEIFFSVLSFRPFFFVAKMLVRPISRIVFDFCEMKWKHGGRPIATENDSNTNQTCTFYCDISSICTIRLRGDIDDMAIRISRVSKECVLLYDSYSYLRPTYRYLHNINYRLANDGKFSSMQFCTYYKIGYTYLRVYTCAVQFLFFLLFLLLSSITSDFYRESEEV